MVAVVDLANPRGLAADGFAFNPLALEDQSTEGDGSLRLLEADTSDTELLEFLALAGVPGADKDLEGGVGSFGLGDELESITHLRQGEHQVGGIG
jgi:hypothetical protein